MKTKWLQLGIAAVAGFVIWTGSSAILPYLPFFLQGEGHSSLVMVGFVVAAFHLGSLLFASPLGWLSDTLGRKPIMVGSMALLTVVSLLFTRTVDPRWFILLRLLQGASAAVGAVIFAYVAQVSAPKERSRALGVVMSASTGGGIAGPAVGAALYHSAGGGRGGFHTIFYFIAALAAFAAVVIVSLIREPTAAPSRRAVLDVRKRWSRYRHAVTPAVVGFLIVGLTANIAYGGYLVIWSVWLERLGASTAVISLMWVAMSAPMLLTFAGGILADRHSRFVLMFGGYGLAALGFVFFGLSTNLTLFFIVSVLVGLAYAVSAPAKQGSMIQLSPVQRVGFVQGLDVASIQLGGLLGTLLVPLLFESISGYAFVVCGSVGVSGLVLATPVLAREMRRMDRIRFAEGAGSGADSE